MKVIPTELPEVLVLEPRVFEDERGFFLESWNQRAFNDATGVVADFVQDNQSRSCRGVLRGLHFQLPPRTQGKLVGVVTGTVFDVVVDMRRSSARFGRWVGIELSDSNHRQVWIPPGFAHGFLTLSDSADLLYKVTDFHAPDSEASVRHDDAVLNIAWPDAGVARIVSARDAAAPPLDKAPALY
jgi:dTDP-4-dehydrorhamnose 3,5-epimerase